MNLQVIIPVYHPDKKFKALLASIKKQTISQLSVLIIDSDYNGYYDSDLVGLNVTIVKIKAQDFNHGGTRQMGMDMCPNADIYVFLTQDAILVNEKSIENLVQVFQDEAIGCAYGRQLPHKDANIFAAHARLFNYPEISYKRSMRDKDKFGIKTVFISNSFAAYRKSATKQAGGFPSDTILSEDMYLAAKMLQLTWDIAYVAQAKVCHSHNYTVLEEFKRYFDIGVFHAKESWIRQCYGIAESDGLKFLLDEIKYVLNNNPSYIVEMMLRNIAKICGYKLGNYENMLPLKIKKIFSMNVMYWI